MVSPVRFRPSAPRATRSIDFKRDRAYFEIVHLLGVRSIAGLVIVAALIIFVLIAISTGFDIVNGGWDTPPVRHPL